MSGKLSSGARLIEFQTLDSTNLEAKRRAATGARGPMWIVALDQTAGYGRRGAAWTQAPGDVAATLLFEPGAGPEHLGQLSFVAGLAVAETIAHFAPTSAPTLKWPNDVLAAGRKIAGILLELVGDKDPVVVMGVGVNIVSKPKGVDYPAARLIDFLRPISTRSDLPRESGDPVESQPWIPAFAGMRGDWGGPSHFVRALDVAFDRWRALWRREGFGPIRAAWLEKAAGLGEKIRVRLANEMLDGVFEDLDQTGALVLDCGGTRRLVSAGAVFPAPAGFGA